MEAAFSPKGWTIIKPVAQDGSTRRYSRVEKNGRHAILMDCSHGETPGHNLNDFLRIGTWLQDIGLKSPEIYEAGRDYLVVEDFGDISFKKAITKDNSEELYTLAADVLKELRNQKTWPRLPNYYESSVHIGHRRIIDWYVPTVKHAQNAEGLVEQYLQAWATIEKTLPACPQGFLHIDFHVENLMFLSHEKGIRRCGILDFQGAMIGPQPYDLGNLLEDARMDVPDAAQAKLKADQDDNFKAWYRVLTTQFHCRVLGQFIKMAAKNHQTGYLQYIPRTQRYLKAALNDPLLQPLKEFFDQHEIFFTASPDLKNIKALVRPDAY